MAEPPVFESATDATSRQPIPVDRAVAHHCNTVGKKLQEQSLAAYATSQELDGLLRNLAVDGIQPVDIAHEVNLDLALIAAVLHGENSMVYLNNRAAAQLRQTPEG